MNLSVRGVRHLASFSRASFRALCQRLTSFNSVTAFLFTLPQVVFPYWGLAPQDEHHRLVAWKNRAPLLGLGTAWGVTVLQWGTAAIAFGALACRLKHVWQVVATALIAIVLVTGVALAVFAILKLMVQVEGI